MEIALCGDKTIVVLSEAELTELDEKRDYGGLIMTDQFDQRFMLAVTDDVEVYRCLKQYCDEQGMLMIYVYRYLIEHFRDGAVFDVSEQFGYPMLIATEKGIGKLGYKRGESVSCNYDTSSTRSLQ